MSDRGEIKISDTKACPLQKKDRYKCNYIQQRSGEIVIHLYIQQQFISKKMGG